MFRLIALAFLCINLGFTAGWAQDRAQLERDFRTWLAEDIWPKAAARGVTRETFDRALGGTKIQWDLPDLVLPEATPDKPAPQTQPEFRAPGRYFRQKTLEDLARIGAPLAARHTAALDRIEEKTGVPGRIVLAIWARESAFGRASIPHDAFRVLATKSFISRRARIFERELLAALEIVQAGHIAPERMRSSWAGALGQPQFLPTSFLAYAADGDGDRRADIWESDVDVMASIANYLLENGWVPNRDWGYEVRVPDSLSCTLAGRDNTARIREWSELGITRVSGRPFPAAEQNGDAYLLMPAGRNGPAFLVTPNFNAIKTYNRSDLYALFIGNLADRIAYGVGDFRADWGDVDKLNRGDIKTIQTILEGQGHDVGGADGIAGFKTLRAIGLWQATSGRRATCFPDQQVLQGLTR